MNSVEDLHKLGSLFEDFVYKRDLKRKRVDDDIVTEASPKKVKTVHSLDYESYKERVSSFTDPSWCLYSHESCCFLLPQHLARYGWVSKNTPGQERFLQCVSCREILYLRLPAITSSTFSEMVRKQEERVWGNHAEFCPWSSSPSPVSWSHPVTDKQELVDNAKGLLPYLTDLPWISSETKDKFRDSINIIMSSLEELNIVNTEALETACLLSILGWQRGSLEDTLTDQFRVRRIGLWNFISYTNERDRIEDLKVARELSGSVEEEENSPKKKSETDKKYFDPLREHLVWNPIIVKDESGVHGWETVINSLKNEDAESTSDQTMATMKSTTEKCDNDDNDNNENISVAESVLNKVRALVDLW